MARLDRLASVRELAQLGATIGREFSYELLHAVSPLNEQALQHGLHQLVETGLIYQRGTPPHAAYLFKHALIQDTAYQSLLKSRRQQLHQQIARVLEKQFPETKDTQPELLAHHYTEAKLTELAIPYWRQAGERANQRSAYTEAISHLTKGLELLKTLPDMIERAQQELMLQIALGAPLRATKGYAASEIGATFTRARELCQQLEDMPQLFPVLWGLWYFHLVRGEYVTARELGNQCLVLAQRLQDPVLLMEAHFALGTALSFFGEFILARENLERGISLYDPQQHHSRALLVGQDPKVACCSVAALQWWHLGYPDQAVQRNQEALALAYELSHPFSVVYALRFSAWTHQYRREAHLVHEQVEAGIVLATEHGFVREGAWATIVRGWALATQGQEEGLTQMRQGLAAYRATGSENGLTVFLALLAEEYGRAGQPEEGLTVLGEAFAQVDKTEERWYEAELYRLKGKLSLLQERREHGARGREQEAETCFSKAIDIAQKQQAKSLELRAVMSLSRLWQQQGKQYEAHRMLSEAYNWFTEGFDTKDLQEAKTLLEELSH
jgi:predicted ATPase